MLSLGMDASLALRIASSNAGLPTGSPPPSRAATMIARVSLEDCLPRLESTIAFLCLMLAHLECPDIYFILGASGPASSPRGPIGWAAMSVDLDPAIFKAYDIRGLH